MSMESTTPAVRITDEMIEAACARFVDQSDEIWSIEVWPEGPDDDGSRGDGGRVRLISEQDQDAIRGAMRFALQDALAAAPVAPAGCFECGSELVPVCLACNPDLRARSEPEAGAVAWKWEQWSSLSGKWSDRLTFDCPADHKSARNVEPLYASPAPSDASATERMRADWRPISEHDGHGPVLVTTLPESPKYLPSDPVTAFLDVTGVWRCLGSVGGGAELSQQPTHFAAMPKRPSRAALGEA